MRLDETLTPLAHLVVREACSCWGRRSGGGNNRHVLKEWAAPSRRESGCCIRTQQPLHDYLSQANSSVE